MSNTLEEARRQVEICNACRYCEGYCAVFPAMTRQKAFADGDLSHLANLCHNCRGCYYACQYAPPHEFAINLPAILAETRRESWERYAFPQAFAKAFQRSGLAIAAALVCGFAALFWAIAALRPESGVGFYAVLSHSTMVAIFAPAFLLPLASVAVGLRRYWRDAGGGGVTLGAIQRGVANAATMRNLSGGHGDGCNFEDEDRFSNARRWAHHLTMYGFLLCFASTTAGTVLHYGFDMPAPYGLFSLPKLFGLPGGVMLCIGCAWLIALKRTADPALGDVRVLGADTAFTALLFLVGASGLALYAVGGTALTAPVLALHLGAVLAFFVLTPYSKMAHGFYRLAALIKEEHLARH